MFSDRAIRNCGPSFWNSSGKKKKKNTIKQCKTTKHFRNDLGEGGSVLTEKGVPCATKKSRKKGIFYDQARNVE